jgi:LCP family protein required for cell wall assembly
MRLVKVNLLDGSGGQTLKQPPTRRRLPFLIFGVVFVLFFGLGRLSTTEGASVALAGLNDVPILNKMHLVGSADRLLSGEDDGRINILLLGMGGEGHDGPLLTDTIMLVSVKPEEKKVALLSIPRDLIVPLPDVGWRKINTANAFGELTSPGRGAQFSRTALEGLFGINIPYFVRIDFNGFKEIVDAVGGIDVYVERGFADYTYPTTDHGVQTVSFAQGWQHLDGDQALKYSRSRHGTNGEGSDFARAKRQQKVLAALKDNLLDYRLLKNPAKVSDILASLQSNISTNMQVGEILRLSKMGQDIEATDVVHKVLDDAPGSPLVATNYGGAYVLVPKDDDWQPLRDLAAGLFDDETSAGDVSSVPPPPKIERTAKVEIRNGSGVTGLARTIASKLTAQGFVIVKIGNAESFGYNHTTVYDLTGGAKSQALEALLAALDDESSVISPLPPPDDIPQDADFVVILGSDNA